MPDPALLLTFTILIGLLLAWLFFPEKGLFWRWQAARGITERVLREDALKHLFDCEYHQRRPSVESLAGALHISTGDAAALLTEMQAHNLITFQQDELHLTQTGQTYALQIIRAHRLWERYLADKTGYHEAEWHSQSERQEHNLTPADTQALAEALGHPRFDPHGDPIPTAEGMLAAQKQHTLTELQVGQVGRIVHLEDEPEAIYAQLVAEGLSVGMVLRLIEVTPARIRFWTEGEEHVLAPVVARNIAIVPVVEAELTEPENTERLTALKPGQSGQVVSISRAVRGSERRRLMDLGVIPGTVIKAEMVSPGGDPTAYLIRGALIGLRREQAGMINITSNSE